MDRAARRQPFEPALPPAQWRPLRPSTDPADLPEALRGPGVEWWFCGTAAVRRLVQALQLRPGERLLMPDYLCGVELDAVLHAGAEVLSYRIDRAARVDLDDLARRAAEPGVRAIYLIHYFGFAQDLPAVLEICRRHGLRLIEDCAHSLYGSHAGQALGRWGDAAIFSPRKTLPLPDGGALRLAEGRWPVPAPATTPTMTPAATPPAPRHTWRETLQGIARHCSRLHGRPARLLAGLARRAAQALIHDDGPDKPLSECGSADYAALEGRLHWRMSRRALALLTRSDHARIVERRRRNFQQLAEGLGGLAGLQPLHAGLPEGCCPLVFPLLADDRDGLHARLRAAGIEGFLYWAWPHPALPPGADAAHLRRHLLALPLHQDLGEAEMARTLAVCHAHAAATAPPPGPR